MNLVSDLLDHTDGTRDGISHCHSILAMKLSLLSAVTFQLVVHCSCSKELGLAIQVRTQIAPPPLSSPRGNIDQ